MDKLIELYEASLSQNPDWPFFAVMFITMYIITYVLDRIEKVEPKHYVKKSIALIKSTWSNKEFLAHSLKGTRKNQKEYK